MCRRSRLRLGRLPTLLQQELQSQAETTANTLSHLDEFHPVGPVTSQRLHAPVAQDMVLISMKKYISELSR